MDVHSFHNVLIILHATSATISFFAGCFLIFSLKYASNQRLFNLYWGFLIAMVAFLVCAIFVYWTEYSSAERIIFPGLVGLGIYMLYRARSAHRLLKTQESGWKHGYIEHIGFTLISLFEGFIIVGGLNSGVPGWLVALAGILGVVVGRWVMHLAQQRVA